jgi:hypothetical protein
MVNGEDPDISDTYIKQHVTGTKTNANKYYKRRGGTSTLKYGESTSYVFSL